MPEFFIHAKSFAAPFVSDQSFKHVEADSAAAALEAFADSYKHPAGLYGADAFASADAYYKDAAPLARWLCNKAIAMQEATAGKSAFSAYSGGPGSVEINGERIDIPDPKGGRLVEVPREVSR